MRVVDPRLIRDAQAGNREAMIELLRQIETPVYRTAYYLLGNEQDALDVTQEALLRVFTKLHTYQEKAHFHTWVQRIVTNLCIDLYRRRSDSVMFEACDGSLSDRTSVEEEVERLDLVADVKEAINRLPLHQRTVVILRYLQDFSYQEIADALNLPLNTVKSHLYRARQQLQVWLQDHVKGGVRG